MRVRAIAPVATAVAIVATLAACTEDERGAEGDARPDGDAWPATVVAAVVTEPGPEPDMVPSVGGSALVLVGDQGIVQWRSDLSERIAPSLGLRDSAGVRVEAIAAQSHAALVSAAVDDAFASRQWGCGTSTPMRWRR